MLIRRALGNSLISVFGIDQGSQKVASLQLHIEHRSKQPVLSVYRAKSCCANPSLSWAKPMHPPTLHLDLVSLMEGHFGWVGA